MSSACLPKSKLRTAAMVKSTEGAVKVKKPKTEAMKKKKKLALKEKKRALKAAQPLQPLQPPSKRKRTEGAQSDAPEDGPALDEPAAQPDGAPAEGEKRTRRKKRPTAADTATAADMAGVEQHGQSAVWAVPQLGFRASSGLAWQLWLARRSQKEAVPLDAQPVPRVLELAASKAADFRAFDHPGPTPTSTSSSGARRRWRP